MHLDRQYREWVVGILVVLLVGAVGALLATQGWRSRVPFYDLIPPIDDAYNILAQGKIPAWGRSNSLGSYAPAGSSWLLVPGLALLSDARLFEYPASLLLHIGTLVGVFMLARAVFNLKCAVLAVVLYGFSELGLYFAGSLWPKGHPFFYVWTLYLALLWGQRKDTRYLAGALVLIAAGMYVHMEISPALLILPGVYILYHPPLAVVPTLIGLAVSLLIWLPYLHFDYSHQFSNLISQLRVQRLPLASETAWCNPSLKKKVALQSDSSIKRPGGRDSQSEPSIKPSRDSQSEPSTKSPRGRDLLIWNNLSTGFLGNFERGLRARGVALFLFGLLTLSATIFAWCAFLDKAEFRIPRLRWRLRVGASDARASGLVVWSLLIPWCLLLYASRNQSYVVETRFWWFWPVQVIMIAALLSAVTSSPKISTLRWLGQAAVLIMIVANPVVFERLHGLIVHGWAGSDSYERKVVDYIAEMTAAEGKNNGHIGYETFFLTWVPSQHIADPRLKVGMEFDIMFRFPHRIANLVTCGEGISSHDEYRVTQTGISANTLYPFGYLRSDIKYFRQIKNFVLPDRNQYDYKLSKQFGPYLVWKKLKHPAYQ